MYNDYRIESNDFAAMNSTQIRRVVFSPNRQHSLSIEEMRDGCLCITNKAQIPFEFTLSRERKLIAVVRYIGAGQLQVNSNWMVDDGGVINQEISRNPDLYVSSKLHIDIIGAGLTGMCRMDLKVDNSGCAGMFFSRSELLFIRMNGNRVGPKVDGLIEAETRRLYREAHHQMEQEKAEFNRKIEEEKAEFIRNMEEEKIEFMRQIEEEKFEIIRKLMEKVNVALYGHN